VSLAEEAQEAPDCDAMAKRILVADDSEVIRRQVRAILEPDPDLEICAEAATGLEAVQEVQRCHPDLAVLDFLMPEMSGLEATREIKKIMPTLPVVLFYSRQYSSARMGKQTSRCGCAPAESGRKQTTFRTHPYPAAITSRQVLAACRPTTVVLAKIKDYRTVFATIESHSSGPLSPTL
jgi:chemotaxis response regulator CheB